LDELIRIAELVKAAVNDKCLDLYMPKALSDDESGWWKIMQKINLEVHTKPLGRQKNSLFATLAFDIALCSFYGIGTSVNETQGLEWLLFSANLGNDWAMGMTVPIAFSINENEEAKPWMRLHLCLSMLKGSHHSMNYLARLFPDDYINIRRVIQNQPEVGDSATEKDYVKVQIDRWAEQAEHLDHLYNTSTPITPLDLQQGILLYLERCAIMSGGFVPNDPHQPLETDLAWTAKVFYPQVETTRDTTISITRRLTNLHYFFLLFEHNIDNLTTALDMLKTQRSNDLDQETDVISTGTLGNLFGVYNSPDMNLNYRLRLGMNFKRRQVEMLQLLLSRGADPFLFIATEDGPTPCPFLTSVLTNNAMATDIMFEHATKRGIDISDKLETIAKDYKISVGQLCIDSLSPEYVISSMSELYENSIFSGTSIEIGPNGLPSASDMAQAMLQVFNDDFIRNPLMLDLLRVKWPKRWTGSKASSLVRLENHFARYISESLAQSSSAHRRDLAETASANLLEPVRNKQKWFHKTRIPSFFSFIKKMLSHNGERH
jgi:hypothetical protein